MGSNFEAFNEGYRPANNPTTKHTKIPAITQGQGMTNPVFNNTATMFPSKTPEIIPANAPIKLIKMDSNKNCALIDDLVAPKAFDNPISFVRSFTATNIIFINPIAAPIRVIKAMPMVPFSKKPKFVNKLSAILSLLSI